MTPDDHDGWAERLSAYLDDELSPDEARAFLADLEARPSALREAEELRRVWALLGSYGEEPVPEDFAAGVLAAVGGPTATGTAVPRLALARWRRLAVAAAVLAAAGLSAAVFAWSGGRSSPPSGPTALAALEALPDALLDDDAIARLASLSDEEFEAILATDPSDLDGEAARTASGGG